MGAALAYLVSRYPAVSHTFILREVLALRALGLRVEVASINPPDRAPQAMGSDERAEAQNTYTLKQHGVAGGLAALAWALRRHPRGLLAACGEALRSGQGLGRLRALAYAVEAAMVARWMARRDLHHLHVHFGNAAALVGMLVKTLSGAGLSLTIHGPDEFDDVYGQRLVNKVAAADGVVCISQSVRSQLMRLSSPRHWGKLRLCHLGVDPERYQPSTSRRRPGPPRLLCIGRLTPAKGQLLLLRACAELQRKGLDFELIIVGDGPDRQGLQHSARLLQLQPRVRFTGALNQAQVRAELEDADAFVLPSLAEGIPVVLMEAMACGLPCLSSPVNGIPELIEHERDGLLATPGDTQALAAQLARLISDAALRGKLAEQGRAKVLRQFDLRRNTAQLASFFSSLPAVEEGRAA
ncbi:MAG: glycosyltransferase family 4 protein [Roseateles sp.]